MHFARSMKHVYPYCTACSIHIFLREPVPLWGVQNAGEYPPRGEYQVCGFWVRRCKPLDLGREDFIPSCVRWTFYLCLLALHVPQQSFCIEKTMCRTSWTSVDWRNIDEEKISSASVIQIL